MLESGVLLDVLSAPRVRLFAPGSVCTGTRFKRVPVRAFSVTVWALFGRLECPIYVLGSHFSIYGRLGVSVSRSLYSLTDRDDLLAECAFRCTAKRFNHHGGRLLHSLTYAHAVDCNLPLRL